ncbi:MAG: amidase family protein, partial [Albidovulum sp.]|uniref:amidase family protein n=1 Tax=Albidovulum sp. TaxID=1872424 RepID=UPI003CA73E80
MTRGGSDYRDYDALGLAELVRSKQTSPGELLEEAIARTETQDARLNFLAQEMFDYGRGKIAAGLPEGAFTGVPFLEKDLHMHVAGYPSGQGSRLYADYVPDLTSELVKRHEAAGLVIFGKTTTPEFGVTATTESIAEGPTRNPWNLDHSSGGSSGGAASAVA